jgi:hypothetical protein
MTVPTTPIFVKEDWTSQKWRLNTLYSIVDANTNAIPFVMNEQQEHFLNRLWYWNIIIKARQVGWTTLLSLMALDQCLFNSNYNAVIIAHKLTDATKIFEGKIKFAYDLLPQSIKDSRQIVKEPAGELWLSNGSKCAVDTSARSGTINLLHISEYGKICAQRPDVAQEIKTGSFPAVAPGNFVFVESTTEGTSGELHDMTMDAKAVAESGKKITSLDFRLHFYGWYTRKENVLPTHEVPLVTITKEDETYFLKSQQETGVMYSPEQKAWYVATKKKLGEKMMQENPATLEEAFNASVKGVIYGDELVLMRQNRQFTAVPWHPGIPVHTFWDLGRSKGNAMAVWCMQRVGLRNHLIRYHEAEGVGVGYFATWLQKWGYTFGVHYLPHDARNVQDGEVTTTRADLLRGLISGDVDVGDRIRERDDGIEMTRIFLQQCWIDETNCAEGIKALENYKRKWNESLGQFMSEPLHDKYSNGADALRTGAQGYQAPYATDNKPTPNAVKRRQRQQGSWRA